MLAIAEAGLICQRFSDVQRQQSPPYRMRPLTEAPNPELP